MIVVVMIVVVMIVVVMVVVIVVVITIVVVCVSSAVGVVVEASQGVLLQSGRARSSERIESSSPAVTCVSIDPHAHRKTGAVRVVDASQAWQWMTAGM